MAKPDPKKRPQLKSGTNPLAEVEDGLTADGRESSEDLIYESIMRGGGWRRSVAVARRDSTSMRSTYRSTTPPVTQTVTVRSGVETVVTFDVEGRQPTQVRERPAEGV